MQFYNHQGKPGILITTAEGTHDKPGKNAIQLEKSQHISRTLALEITVEAHCSESLFETDAGRKFTRNH